MYTLEMSTISITDARSRLPELIERAQGEAVFLERRGKLEAVVVSPEQYSRMMDALEDVAELAWAEAQFPEANENAEGEQILEGVTVLELNEPLALPGGELARRQIELANELDAGPALFLRMSLFEGLCRHNC